jgi:hypothetical protein
MATKAKKTTRKPRTIEVVEYAPVLAKKRGRKKAEPAPTVDPVEQPATKLAPVVTDAKPAAKERKITKLSAHDAAAQVLAGGSAMNAKEMIDAMASQGLWTSPGGKTPHATLYSAILREITTKGNESRFVKTERGKFEAR